MATLEKIRSKSVLLIVVIGVALLAFIVGDALTNSRNLFGEGTTVAKIGSEKIDYTEYQQKREELSNMLEEMKKSNPMQAAGYDNQMLAQMAIDQLITEKLVDRAIGKLGIRVTGDQLRYYMFENPVSQKMTELLSALQQSGLQVANPTQAYELIFNPKRNGMTDADMAPYQRAWQAIEEDTKKQVARHTYQRLLTSTVKANALDMQEIYDNGNTTTQVTIAYAPYGNLDPKKYPVSDSELKQLYEQEKNRFRVDEPTKAIGFIAVNIAPSAADMQKSKALATKVAGMLKGNGQIDKDTKKEGVVINRRTVRAQDLSGKVKDYVTSAPQDSISIISNDNQGFTIVRMGSHTTSTDSIQVDLVAVAGNKLPAQVMAALNGGLSLDSISSRFSADSVAVQAKEQWFPLMTAQGSTQAVTDEQLAKLREAEGQYIILEETPNGSALAKLVKQAPAKDIYEFDEVTYQLNPSNQTIDSARTKLEKFLAQNNSADKFMKNAGKSGYTVQDFEVSQSSPAIPNEAARGMYPESRQVVRWVMIDGKAGEVSHIYESKDARNPALYAVAIVSEYDDYTPMSTKRVNEYLTGKVRRSKAGDALVKQYSAQAGSMEQVGKAMNAEPREVETLRFGRSANVQDDAVLGRMLGSKQGAKVYVVKGDDGVYAYRINGKQAGKEERNNKQLSQRYINSLGIDYSKMLRGNEKVKNNAYKFEAGD